MRIHRIHRVLFVLLFLLFWTFLTVLLRVQTLDLLELGTLCLLCFTFLFGTLGLFFCRFKGYGHSVRENFPFILLIFLEFTRLDVDCVLDADEIEGVVFGCEQPDFCPHKDRFSIEDFVPLSFPFQRVPSFDCLCVKSVRFEVLFVFLTLWETGSHNVLCFQIREPFIGFTDLLFGEIKQAIAQVHILILITWLRIYWSIFFHIRLIFLNERNLGEAFLPFIRTFLLVNVERTVAEKSAFVHSE